MIIPQSDSAGDAEPYLHMERYVNDGSPSGFTEVHATSDETSPFGDVDRFPLRVFDDTDLRNEALGGRVPILNGHINFAHPDSIDSTVLAQSGRSLIDSSFEVSPVSGGRTFLLRDQTPAGYLKLTYDVGRIGRVDRQLTREHCVGSLEVSNRLENAIQSGTLGAQTGMIRELAARVSYLPMKDGSVYEWGSIFREATPFPHSSARHHLIPGFSLFSRDRRAPDDPPLLVQIIRASGENPDAYLENLIKMIVTSYWGIVTQCALHVEAHGQNCFIEFDERWIPRRFVVKDMDSVDKDLLLADHFGLEHEWASSHMCFDHRVSFYDIRASFMYDFKLGTYLLQPMMTCASREFGIDEKSVASRVREYVRETYLPLLPENYFPRDGRWYFADDTERVPGTERVYHSKPNPLFR